MKFDGLLDYKDDQLQIASLFLYLFTIAFELLTLFIIIYLYRRLPKTFSFLALVCTLCMLTGFCLSLLVFLTENSYDECSLNRRISYPVRYIGFYLFDVLQMKKIIAIISSNSNKIKLNHYFIYFLALCRLASYVYNSIYVLGKPFYDADGLGDGPCVTVFSQFLVYQEHFVSVVFEFGLFSYLLWFIYKTAKSKAVFKMIRSLIDFEFYTFIIYLVAEIIFLAFYRLDKGGSNVGIFNIFYLNLPVVLFLANSINIISKRKRFHTILEANNNTSEDMMHKPEYRSSNSERNYA
ncbi:hypothetical protein HDV04_002184 [Boothiomyces sp. JEL0838]|nr:hypothetical protein HDV04_002184 [Boothiomyces sp. JEL0838]